MKLSNDKKQELDNMILTLSEKISNVEYVQTNLGSLSKYYKQSSIAVSYPALCVLFSELQAHFPEHNFDICAYDYLKIVNNYLGKNSTNDISLFDGLCGVGFAANCMSNNGERYQSFIEGLNDYIIEISEKNILEYETLPLTEFSYDIMYGFTGVASYLLNFKSESRVRSILLNILDYLSNLSKIGDNGIPEFAINAKNSQLFSSVTNAKVQYVNLGVSHGIPGILLLLCKSYKEGIYVKNQLEAINCLSTYILNSCMESSEDIFWESQKIIGVNSDKKLISRDAWCYGTPGVAYSLLVASGILNDSKMYNLALSSMKVSLKRLGQVISPTFCHGLSGLCSLARKFYEYTDDYYFYESYTKLFEKIIESYNVQYPFGFKDKEIEKGHIIEKDEIGILTGTSGVILTLLSCYRPIKTQWDSIFLL